MPITEIVRVLAQGLAPGPEGELRVHLSYDVDGRMGPDEEATSQPSFWLRVLHPSAPAKVLGPFQDEGEALDRAEGLSVTWD